MFLQSCSSSDSLQRLVEGGQDEGSADNILVKPFSLQKVCRILGPTACFKAKMLDRCV